MWTVFADKSDIEDYKHDCGITAEQAYEQFFKNFLIDISNGPCDFRGVGILGAITHMEEIEFIDSVLQDLPDYECDFSINSSKTRINCKSSGEFSDTYNEQADGFKTFEMSYDYDGFYMTEMHGKETSKGRKYNSEDGTFVDGYEMIHTGDTKTTYGSADVEFIDVSKIPYVPSIY